jgi:SAM-dependent methyltransferase
MSSIEILSNSSSAEDFPNEWYGIAIEDHFWFEWRLRVFLQQIRDIGISREDSFRVLEIGCGHGVFRRQLEGHTHWCIDGCDLNKEGLLRNNVKRGRTFLYNIHDRASFFEKAYDFIILYDILEHIEDTRRFLESTLYHLKDGGWIFINVPAFNSMMSQYDRAMGHLRRYNVNMLKKELLYQGLKIKDMRCWGLSMLPLLLMRKFLNFKKYEPKDIIRKGIAPPNLFFNNLLKTVMCVETFLINKPIMGTSLMAAAMKLAE